LISPPAEAETYTSAGGVRSLPPGELHSLLGAVLEEGAALRFTALGGSMHPFIRHGDTLTIAPLGERGPRLGDVCAFAESGSERLLIHRVISQRGARCLLKGDALGSPDGAVPAEALLGVVREVWRGGQPACAGLGPERLVLAALSRWGLLRPAVRGASRVLRRVRLL
jgi:hypothetical protein